MKLLVVILYVLFLKNLAVRVRDLLVYKNRPTFIGMISGIITYIPAQALLFGNYNLALSWVIMYTVFTLYTFLKSRKPSLSWIVGLCYPATITMVCIVMLS